MNKIRLFVFDVDGVILEKTNTHRRRRNQTGIIVIKSLLALKNVRVGIWTSATKKNILWHLEGIFGEDISKFAFIWYRSRCLLDIKRGGHSTIKPTFLISLNPKISELFSPKISPSEIMIVDDDLDKIMMNPRFYHWNNVYEPSSFYKSFSDLILPPIQKLNLRNSVEDERYLENTIKNVVSNKIMGGNAAVLRTKTHRRTKRISGIVPH